MKKALGFILVALIVLGLGKAVHAYVSGSNNYRLQADSINFGGNLSQSSSYRMEDTLGEVGTGTSTDGTNNTSAGYQAMVVGPYSITVTSPGNVTLSPEINVSTGGEANGEAAWTIVSDSPAGYSFYLKSATDPALKSSNDSFANYSPSFGGTPDFAWAQEETDAFFGFSPESSDLVQKYKDNGTSCNTGANDTASKCWSGFGTTNEEIVRATAANNPSGSVVTIKLRAKAGSSTSKKSGNYAANLTATVVSY